MNNKPAKYQCTICPYVYDPEKGDPSQNIAPGTPFEQLPDTWVCPTCKKPKSVFVKIEEVIANDSKDDVQAQEVFDMAVKIQPGNDVFVCDVCGWEYDPAIGVPELGIAPGTPFSQLPDDFICPLCGAGKNAFSPKEEITFANGASITNA